MCAEAKVKGNPALAPRNVPQVQNAKARRKKLEFPEDQRTLLAYHAIVHPQTLPDCRTYHGKTYAVCCLPQMDQHVKQVFQICGNLTLNYDTTYQCGPFYVSILSFRHPLFDEEPVIPMTVLVHEGKGEVGHAMLFQNRKISLPQLDDHRTVFISDREASFKTVRGIFFPNSLFAFCHIHILKVS